MEPGVEFVDVDADEDAFDMDTRMALDPKTVLSLCKAAAADSGLMYSTNANRAG